VTDPEAAAPQERRRHTSHAVAAWVSGIVVIVLLALAALLPVPFLVVSPGPTFNTIGEIDGVPLVEISDTTVYPVTGNLDMTTIRESGAPRSPLTVYQALLAWADPDQAVLPRELLYPDDVSGEEVEQRNAALFSTSQSDAIAAALNAIGEPVIADVVVTAVFNGTPAEGRLQPGERIMAIDGEWITTPDQVGEAVRSKPIGSTLIFMVEREGTPVDVELVSVANPDDPQVGYVGIGVGVNYRAEFPIEFTLTDVGGPSAGLMFSLAIVDKLTPTDLTGGGHVAGTGTIDPSGNVGAIGGIRQKLAGAREAGATLFLMPEVHCAEVEGRIPDGLTVVPVATLDAAIETLDAWRAGETLRTCAPS
jgi:PDZ domain-containing protein